MQTMVRGVLAKWDDAKGFGFVSPSDGSGSDVFVHISSIRRGLFRRPKPGDVVYFRVETEVRTGKPRACDVSLVAVVADDAELERRAYARESARARPWLRCSLVASLPFALSCYLLLATGNCVPLIAYAVVSIFTIWMYWHDKCAALADAWRVKETHLHLAELLGGWPGAMVAQCWIRHKSSKRSYQTVFWLIVFLHLAAWGDQLLAQGEVRKAVWRKVSCLMQGPLAGETGR